MDIWLRGTDVATTATLDDVNAAPETWLDEDVKRLLEGMLRTMHRLRHGAGDDVPISLRGLSWIVNPFEDGVVIAIEITLGAAIAGPFNIDQASLEGRISRVLRQEAQPLPDLH